MSHSLLKLALLGSLTIVSLAQTKPNFSGEWKLDTMRSRLDPKADWKSATMKIDHAEPKIKIDMDADTGHGRRQYTLDLQTDGTESQQTIDGNSCKTIAHWGTRTGERLQIDTTCAAGSGTIVTSREMKLGSKGKILTTILSIKDGKTQKRSYEFYTKANAH